jgi:chemotaxis response regulator CheB
MEDLTFIVGIGSSAGGMQALYDLFLNLEEHNGLAFVVVPHLNRDYQSVLPSLLAKKTFLRTKRIKNGDVVKPGFVYVLPENKKVTIHNGVLILKERPAEEKINKAIDAFFISLAEDQREKAIGIILSGLGSDGTEGAIHIKKCGGRVVVQEPSTAQFSNMPTSTISSDHPDDIVPPDKISDVLLSYLKEKVESSSK